MAVMEAGPYRTRRRLHGRPVGLGVESMGIGRVVAGVTCHFFFANTSAIIPALRT
jgi:hypothetical protein